MILADAKSRKNLTTVRRCCSLYVRVRMLTPPESSDNAQCKLAGNCDTIFMLLYFNWSDQAMLPCFLGLHHGQAITCDSDTAKNIALMMFSMWMILLDCTHSVLVTTISCIRTNCNNLPD